MQRNQTFESRQILRVLIMGDDGPDRELMTNQLASAWPFEAELCIEQAADGHTALHKIQQQRLKLIVLDWSPPVRNGDNALCVLRDAGVRLPVVVVSDSNRDEIDTNIESLGAVFLHKSQLTAARFRNAVAMALLLCKRVPEPVVANAC